MRILTLAVTAAALALAACGQSAETEDAAPAAPQSLMEQVQAMGEADQLVFAYTQLTAYQQAHPDVLPFCTSPRATESRGVIPTTVADDSIYAAHKGSLVISVQCGELRSLARMDPAEHWLVVFAPGATESAVVNCAGERSRDLCPRLTADPAPAPAAAPTPAAP